MVQVVYSRNGVFGQYIDVYKDGKLVWSKATTIDNFEMVLSQVKVVVSKLVVKAA